MPWLFDYLRYTEALDQAMDILFVVGEADALLGFLDVDIEMGFAGIDADVDSFIVSSHCWNTSPLLDSGCGPIRLFELMNRVDMCHTLVNGLSEAGASIQSG